VLISSSGSSLILTDCAFSTDSPTLDFSLVWINYRTPPVDFIFWLISDSDQVSEYRYIVSYFLSFSLLFSSFLSISLPFSFFLFF
jgi:hypothetical protein